MKKLSTIIGSALLAAALSFSVSCTKQEVAQEDAVSSEEAASSGEGVDPADEKVYCTIGVGLPVDPMKTTVSAEGKVVWAADDEIGAFAEGTIYRFTLKTGAGSENAIFVCTDEGIKGKTLDGIAVYPYKNGLTYDSGTGAIQVYVPDEQSYSLSSAPMLATISELADGGGYRYFFHNLGGIFQFTCNNVPPEARSLKFTATTDISGVFTLTSGSDYLTVGKEAASSGAATKSITVSIPLARPDGSVTVQVPVPIGAYSGFSVVLCDASGAEIASTHKAPSATITSKINKLSPIKPITYPEGLKVLWAFDDDGAMTAFSGNVPAIDADGNVYVMPGYANKLYKLDKNGQVCWTRDLAFGGRTNGNPSLEYDGSVVYVLGGVAGTTPHVYAINTSDGSIKWDFTDFPSFLTSPYFDKSFVAVGEGDNVYVAPADNSSSYGTLLAIKKSDGTLVSYVPPTDTEGGSSDTNLKVYTPGGAVAISAEGLVVFNTYRGAIAVNQSILDTPPSTHATYGKYTTYAYNDFWPNTWANVALTSQGVICARKGNQYGKNVILSCVQEGVDKETWPTTSRMQVYCSAADEVKNLTMYRQADLAADHADFHCYWRFSMGANSESGGVCKQDQGGIVMGHDDLTVLVPLKGKNPAAAGSDDKSRSYGPAGILSLWMARETSKGKNLNGAGSCWRYNISNSTYEDGNTHSVENHMEVSGAPAVDNNGWVHLASRDRYHIFNPSVLDPYTIEEIANVSWVDLLNTCGYLHTEADIDNTNAWTSVKIGDNGLIYMNMCLNSGLNKGAIVCLSYPGVTGPDATSSWPQKGADPRNSCCQVSDASKWTDNTDHPFSWD
ncbi:MAG: PQQ-binding-like beta-propeller repeat protein [Bacteroidales bacterium]|nr:PQQ-binding-like beta-propeller repeat protein [Bacteroidales bacterium]